MREGHLREQRRSRNLVCALKFLFSHGSKWFWPLAEGLCAIKLLVNVVCWWKGYWGRIYLLVKMLRHHALPLY